MSQDQSLRITVDPRKPRQPSSRARSELNGRRVGKGASADSLEEIWALDPLAAA